MQCEYRREGILYLLLSIDADHCALNSSVFCYTEKITGGTTSLHTSF